MTSMTAHDLRARLARDLPEALLNPPALPDGDAARAELDRPTPGAKKPPADMLATQDALVRPERLPEVARFLRDALGYQLLLNITAVDYLAAGLFELVYHFAHLDGGPPLALKLRVPRDLPVVPSITPIWPGADLQEREAFDLYGVQFPGHADLRRLYMWDEFEGYPMRKDFPKQGDKYFLDE